MNWQKSDRKVSTLEKNEGKNKIKSHYACSLILAHDLIGGKWKQRILWHILHGDNRFSLLQKGIPEITPKVFTSQIRELEESGIIVKEVVKEAPPKIIIYRINDAYEELISIVKAICDFSKHYAKDHLIEIPDE